MIQIITSENMEKPVGAPGIAIARLVRKIAEEIAPLYETGKLEFGGNRFYGRKYENLDSEEVDFKDIFLNYRPGHWYSIARGLIHVKLDEGIWFFKIDKVNIEYDKIKPKEIIETIENSFEKYKRELPKNVKIVLS